MTTQDPHFATVTKFAHTDKEAAEIAARELTIYTGKTAYIYKLVQTVEKPKPTTNNANS